MLPRISKFSRRAAGTRSDEQVVAANLDRVGIVHGLDVLPNPRRLERYLAVAWESGAQPEIVLSKADVAVDLEDSLRIVTALSFGIPIWTVSILSSVGIAELARSLAAGTTMALLGPSGVGKSSLINHLVGTEVLDIGEVRSGDKKGRHITTRRQLVRLPSGALLLDTPGMRELRVWDLDSGAQDAFPDIEDVAAGCRFRDCQHESEPGCAVLSAAASGAISPERLASYRKLLAEAAFQRRKSDPEARAEALAETKSAMKTLKFHPKYR